MIDQRLSLAEALRDDAIGRVDAHADPDWKEHALATVRALCEQRKHFTTDAVWALLGTRAAEPRAMGAVMRRAESAGYCSPTENWHLSVRPECHRRPLRVWRSRLVGVR